MSLSAFVSGGKATTEAIVEDTPVDKPAPASKPAPAKSTSPRKRRESLSELPSFPEFVEGARTPAERIVPPKDTLETIYGKVKEEVPYFGTFGSVPVQREGELRDPDVDQAGRLRSDTRPQASGVFSAPAVTGKEFEGLGTLTGQEQMDKISNALARASTDRQNAEDALGEMEKTGADEDKIAQGRRDLLHAQRVYTQLVNIRDKTLPRREQLKGLYDSMSE